jgi:hypothetical protein
MFMSYIAERPGPESHRELVNKTAGSILPSPWVMNRIARKATGKSFSTLYGEWRRDLQFRYRAQAEQIRAAGLTTSERIAGGERYALFPRVSRDGSKLAYVVEDGRNTSSIVILDLASRFEERTRRNSLAPVAWANNQLLYTTQPELRNPYTIHSELYYQLRGRQERLTHGARYDAVDVDSAGRKFVVIKHARGMTAIVQRDVHTGSEQLIMAPRSDVQWAFPRWSPDGTRIAVQRWSLGGQNDVVVIDTLGNYVGRGSPWTSAETATDVAPGWSPDGRWVLFTSDRSGINNIYAYDPADRSGLVFQITNVLTGAFYPDVSPDGQWIYYSAYHANGYSIERTRYDPVAWRVVSYSATQDSVPVVVPEQSGPPLPVRSYSALRSLLPKFWFPVFETDSVQGDFLGFYTVGVDDISRHAYTLMLMQDFGNGRTQGFIDYAFAGLGNPVISFSASREYDTLLGHSLRREDNVALFATRLRRRWRSSLSLTMGAEAVVVSRDTTTRDTTLRVRDPEDRLIGVVGGIGFANARTPAYAISREDGLRASLFARRRFDIEPVFRDATYTEVSGATSAYKSINAFGFAHHVIAAQAKMIYRSGLGVGPTDVGGVENSLPVRGFDEIDRIGFRAWSAALEYRAPIAMIGRGIGMWPFYIDRVAATAFVDAGNASCTTAQRALYAVCAGNPERDDQMLLSAGVEVSSNVAILSFLPGWLRLGIAQPIRGPRTKPKVYVTFLPAF